MRMPGQEKSARGLLASGAKMDEVTKKSYSGREGSTLRGDRISLGLLTDGTEGR